MDPFTQRVFERAEQRSKALGLATNTKIPLNDRNQEPPKYATITKHTLTASPQKSTNTGHKSDAQPSTSSSPPTKIIKRITERQLSDDSDSKENHDVGIEINITTGPNVQVQVDVEEKKIDSDGNVTEVNNRKTSHVTYSSDAQECTPIIRDSSRNRLNRLGALYSDSENLSSPIHRTEARFDAEIIEAQQESTSNRNMGKPRLGKLAALASTIKNWEDDTSSSNVRSSSTDDREHTTQPKIVGSSLRTVTKTKPTSPTKSEQTKKFQSPTKQSSNFAGKPSKDEKSRSDDKNPSKKLQWDKGVMEHLELQGFQRRESTTSKLTYDYNDKRERTPPPKPTDDKTNKKTFESTVNTGNKSKTTTKPPSPAKSLVSGRAAMFESVAVKKPAAGKTVQKDPAQMSLKERLALFEKNKGTALVPKAALGMSASVKEIMGDQHKEMKNQPVKPVVQDKFQVKSSGYNKPVFAETKASGSGIRNTVAALMSNSTTISESQISTDVRKQREHEMNILLNRFQHPSLPDQIREGEAPSTPSDIQIKTIPMTMEVATPPPAPPMPISLHSTGSIKSIGREYHQHVDGYSKLNNHKRRSDGDEDKQLKIKPQQNRNEEVKRARVTRKEGRLYPTLSDVESTRTNSDQDNLSTAPATGSDQSSARYQNVRTVDADEDSYMDSEDSANDITNLSLGREILNAVRMQDEQPQKQWKQPYPNLNDTSSADSEMSDNVGYLDDDLNEALDDEQEYEDDEDDYEEDQARKVTPKKGSLSSNSFSYEKCTTKHVHYKRSPIIEEERVATDYKSPVKSQLIVNPSDDNNMVTLTHTVSFYRRQQGQQNSVNNTPVRKIVRTISESNEETDSDYTDAQNEKHLVMEKESRLLDEMSKQEKIISQTSRALNLCASTIEFSGSIEAVDGERHLLVATHRHQAAKNELQRLRVEQCIRRVDAPTERGRLVVQDITIPLRKDYTDKLASEEQFSGHHVVCLLKYNEHILATKSVQTLPGLNCVKFPDVLQLNNVYADFKVTLEIYGMKAQREILPHDIKYHINVKKGGNRTPKSKKGIDSCLIMPPVQSPGGPNAVRKPSLSYYGMVIFSLREIQRTQWTCQVSGVSPLEGIVHMKVNCELTSTVDYKGFLTMLEDVSGFGAWHRRWCRLHGNILSYWKYPDDEKKKPPIGSLDLYSCCSRTITTAPRDVCARLNTMLLELERPSQETDRESLVTVKGNKSIVSHLLSADTKEEREEWCTHFNKALALLRALGQPY